MDRRDQTIYEFARRDRAVGSYLERLAQAPWRVGALPVGAGSVGNNDWSLLHGASRTANGPVLSLESSLLLLLLGGRLISFSESSWSYKKLDLQDTAQI